MDARSRRSRPGVARSGATARYQSYQACPVARPAAAATAVQVPAGAAATGRRWAGCCRRAAERRRARPPGVGDVGVGGRDRDRQPVERRRARRAGPRRPRRARRWSSGTRRRSQAASTRGAPGLMATRSRAARRGSRSRPRRSRRTGRRWCPRTGAGRCPGRRADRRTPGRRTVPCRPASRWSRRPRSAARRRRATTTSCPRRCRSRPCAGAAGSKAIAPTVSVAWRSRCAAPRWRRGRGSPTRRRSPRRQHVRAVARVDRDRGHPPRDVDPAAAVGLAVGDRPGPSERHCGPVAVGGPGRSAAPRRRWRRLPSPAWPPPRRSGLLGELRLAAAQRPRCACAGARAGRAGPPRAVPGSGRAPPPRSARRPGAPPTRPGSANGLKALRLQQLHRPEHRLAAVGRAGTALRCAHACRGTTPSSSGP